MNPAAKIWSITAKALRIHIWRIKYAQKKIKKSCMSQMIVGLQFFVGFTLCSVGMCTYIQMLDSADVSSLCIKSPSWGYAGPWGGRVKTVLLHSRAWNHYFCPRLTYQQPPNACWVFTCETQSWEAFCVLLCQTVGQAVTESKAAWLNVGRQLRWNCHRCTLWSCAPPLLGFLGKRVFV